MHGNSKGGSNFSKDATLLMTPTERKNASIMVVEPAISERAIMHSALVSLGFGSVSTSDSYVSALDKIKQRKYTHVIFSTTDDSMPVVDFVDQLLDMDSETIAIPASHNPNSENVFTLLQHRARGFLVKPYTPDALDIGVVSATKGDPISDVVLKAKNRNEAFSALIAAGLDKLATAARQSRTFDSAKKDIPKFYMNLRQLVDLAKLFAEGGEARLVTDMEEFFLKLAEGPASRLGRLRNRLANQRGVVKPVQEQIKTGVIDPKLASK